jgi:hypothetical protein
MFTGIIFAAAAVCAVASMVIGMTWYTPKVFGSIWMRGLGMDMNDTALQAKMKKRMPASMAGNIIANFVKALVFFTVLAAFGVSSIGGAVVVSLLVSVGLLTTTHFGGALWEMRDPGLFWVNAGFTIVEFAAYALILAAWVL